MKLHSLIQLSAIPVLIALSGCVTTAPYQPTEVKSVVDVPGQSQKEIYDKTRQWFSQYFVSGESVVDYEDPETGTIIGNGIAGIGSDVFGIIQQKIKFNIRIDTRDGQFRALTNIHEHTNSDTSQTYRVNVVPQSRAEKAENHVNQIVEDIKAYVLDSRHATDADW